MTKGPGAGLLPTLLKVIPKAHSGAQVVPPPILFARSSGSSVNGIVVLCFSPPAKAAQFLIAFATDPSPGLNDIGIWIVFPAGIFIAAEVHVTSLPSFLQPIFPVTPSGFATLTGVTMVRFGNGEPSGAEM